MSDGHLTSFGNKLGPRGEVPDSKKRSFKTGEIRGKPGENFPHNFCQKISSIGLSVNYPCDTCFPFDQTQSIIVQFRRLNSNDL